MRSVIVDLIDDNAINLLKNLEEYKIISIRANEDDLQPINPFTKYKGKFTKQSIEEIDRQLSDLRDEWH